MFDDPSRRTFLRYTTAGTVPVLSGCSGLLPGSGNGSSDPDAGNDSYGIFLVNETGETHTVQVKVARPFKDETAFVETVDIDSRESREWEQVITENKEWAVSGELKGTDTSSSIFVTPGSEVAPEVENIQLVVRRIGSRDELVIAVTYKGDPRK